MPDPRCPRCHVKGVPHGDREYLCPNCKGLFDDSPDEGGDYSHNPAVRIERQERERERLQRRLRGGR